MSKSTQTLTQSGLLAVLLQRQRHVSYLTRRRANRKHQYNAVWTGLTRAWQAYMAPKPFDDFARSAFVSSRCRSQNLGHPTTDGVRIRD